jgi:hypothetical protein
MTSHEGFNLALGFSPCFAEEFLRTVFGEMRAEQTQPRDMHPPILQKANIEEHACSR